MWKSGHSLFSLHHSGDKKQNPLRPISWYSSDAPKKVTKGILVMFKFTKTQNKIHAKISNELTKGKITFRWVGILVNANPTDATMFKGTIEPHRIPTQWTIKKYRQRSSNFVKVHIWQYKHRSKSNNGIKQASFFFMLKLCTHKTFCRKLFYKVKKRSKLRMY